MNYCHLHDISINCRLQTLSVPVLDSSWQLQKYIQVGFLVWAWRSFAYSMCAGICFFEIRIRQRISVPSTHWTTTSGDASDDDVFHLLQDIISLPPSENYRGQSGFAWQNNGFIAIYCLASQMCLTVERLKWGNGQWLCDRHHITWIANHQQTCCIDPYFPYNSSK